LGWKRVLQECFPALLGLKPAQDAKRVASGSNQEPGQAITPLVELSLGKIIELFAEAIPGVLIQMRAISTTFEEGAIPAASWISLAVSALSSGFISASIIYDVDTSPKFRSRDPSFYGFVPPRASKRTLVFAAMLFFTTGVLLMRCIAIALLLLKSKQTVLAYLCFDQGLFLALKIGRGDFWWWFPIGGNMEIITSLLIRVITKFISDFTSFIYLRNPKGKNFPCHKSSFSHVIYPNVILTPLL
jgi:hypothetical protein